jgi:fibronectin-binding autotransporter adhesin
MNLKTFFSSTGATVGGLWPIVLALLLASVVTLPAATVRTWTGSSATTGNWTSAANWESGAPVAGDVLNFVSTGLRKTSNTNNYGAGTVFSVINVFGSGYRLRGNGVTISNSITAGTPTGTNIIDLDISAGQFALRLRTFSNTDRLTFNGDINLHARTLTTEGPGDFIIAGVISGTGGISKNHVGDLSLAGLGANTYTGPTTVAAGILRLGRYNLAGLTPVGTTAIPGDLVVGSFVSTLIGDIAVLDRDNQIANSSTVSVYPTGSLELSDENDTIGELRLAGGTVTTGAGVLGVEGGIYALSPINVTKDSVIAGRLTLGARGDEPQRVDVAQGIQLNIPAQISGVSSAHLIKTNRGELVLSASNTFSGDVEIAGGTLTISHGSALGNTTGVTRPTVGTLAITGSIGISESLEVPGPASTVTVTSGSPSWLGSVLLEDDLTIGVPTNSFLTILGLMSGPAGWTKLGSGTLQFKTVHTNTYAGTGWVRQGDMILDGVFNQPVISGSLVIGHTNNPPGSERVSYIKQQQIGDAVPVTINKSGVLALQGFNDTIGSLAGPGDVQLGSGTLVIGANNNSTVFSGVISGTGSLVKTGSATLTLTGTNTYSGVTTNLAGTLLVNGVLSGSPVVQVRPGSILGGVGLVQSISVFAGGQVSPGASPGNLTASGSLLLSNGSLNIEVNGLVPGTGYDRITTAGTVTLGGALNVAVGFTPSPGQSFMILEKTGAGPIAGTFSGLAEGATFAASGVAFQITYAGGTGNDVVLTRAAVPPSNISSIAAITPERIQILGSGIPGLSYVLEATLHLNAPIPWMPIATNSASGAGIYEFIDAYGDNGNLIYPQRFYRVRWP